MQSFFDFIKEHPPVKRLQVNDLLLAEYQCPLDSHNFDIWSQHNYFIYIISGQKKWLTRNQEKLVKKGYCLFVRKGAHTFHQFFESQFCAIVLFVADSFKEIMFIVIQHQIHNSEKFQQCANEVFPVPEELHIHQFLSAPDLTKAFCLYDAPSIERLSQYINDKLNEASSQNYYPVLTEHAIGLPKNEL